MINVDIQQELSRCKSDLKSLETRAKSLLFRIAGLEQVARVDFVSSGLSQSLDDIRETALNVCVAVEKDNSPLFAPHKVIDLKKTE